MYPITFQECIEQSLRKQTLKFGKSPLRFNKSFKIDVRPLPLQGISERDTVVFTNMSISGVKSEFRRTKQLES